MLTEQQVDEEVMILKRRLRFYNSIYEKCEEHLKPFSKELSIHCYLANRLKLYVVTFDDVKEVIKILRDYEFIKVNTKKVYVHALSVNTFYATTHYKFNVIDDFADYFQEIIIEIDILTREDLPKGLLKDTCKVIEERNSEFFIQCEV